MKALRLTKGNWWNELAEGVSGLPLPLVDMLRGLVGATKTESIPPVATDRLQRLAKEHLQPGIGEDFYNVMVDVPANLETHNSVFRLHRTLPYAHQSRFGEIEMILQQVVLTLLEAGASDAEAEDLAEVMHGSGGWDQLTFHRNARVEEARTWLNDWRLEQRASAASIREDRQRRLDAGYRSIAVADPVYLNGKTAW
jgi:hypothetical protein